MRYGIADEEQILIELTFQDIVMMQVGLFVMGAMLISEENDLGRDYVQAGAKLDLITTGRGEESYVS